MFFYHKKGEVAMYSSGPMDLPQFEVTKYDPTPEEMEKIKQNYLLTIEDGKLVCNATPRIQKQLDEEKRVLDEGQRRQKVQALQQKVGKGALEKDELQAIVKQLLDLLV